MREFVASRKARVQDCARLGAWLLAVSILQIQAAIVAIDWYEHISPQQRGRTSAVESQQKTGNAAQVAAEHCDVSHSYNIRPSNVVIMSQWCHDANANHCALQCGCLGSKRPIGR
jgi:hypothetical protein